MSKWQLFIPSEHGFFDDLVTMLVSLASYMFTMHVSIASNNPRPFEERPLTEWMNYIAPVRTLDYPLVLAQNATDEEIVVFPTELLMHLSLDSWPQFVEYQVRPHYQSEAQARLEAQGNRRVIARIAGASFTNYYSKVESAVKSKYGEKQDKWPETARFAWLIRNGFAHGGRLHIKNKNLRPAIWSAWSFDHCQDGKDILFETGMLGIGDLITLMQDFDIYVKP